ncbi:MAG: GNAT family N-acetyltransferase [Pseudomonadota bacterium]
MSITVRRARLSEAELLTDLSMRAKQSNGYDGAFMEACREELTVTASRLKAGEYWVADGGSVCGCVCLSEIADRQGEVHAFFVDPDFQRRGIGRLLWRKVIERASLSGMTALYLDADPAAVPFYRTMGFIEIGQVPSGSIEGRMLPRMMFRLDQPRDSVT